jgi:hypothetical protein
VFNCYILCRMYEVRRLQVLIYNNSWLAQIWDTMVQDIIESLKDKECPWIVYLWFTVSLLL